MLNQSDITDMEKYSTQIKAILKLYGCPVDYPVNNLTTFDDIVCAGDGGLSITEIEKFKKHWGFAGTSYHHYIFSLAEEMYNYRPF